MDIGQYVLLASDASDPQRQQQANMYLQQWTTTAPNDAKIATILQMIQTAQHESVVFFSLTAFLRLLPKAAPVHRATIRQALLQRIMQDPNTIDQVNGNLQINENSTMHVAYRCAPCWMHTFVRTKIGVVLAKVIELDFPEMWPSAFADLQNYSQVAPDIFLRTLVAMTDDFGYDESEITTKVKDILRGFAPSGTKPISLLDVSIAVPAQQSISAQLISTVMNILSQSAERIGTHNGTLIESTPAFQLYILCLTVIKGFSSWLDLTLLMKEQVLRSIFDALRLGSITDSPTADAGVLVMEFFQELVARGMEDDKKIALLKHINVLSQIHEVVDLDTVDASSIDVVMEVAKFLNRTGNEMIGMAMSTRGGSDYATLWSQLLSLFFQCLAYDDIDVSNAVLPFATGIAHPQNFSIVDPGILPRLLSTMYQQMRYPVDFEFDHEDDDEAEEEMYRTELRKLYQALIRIAPEPCLQFTCHTLSQLAVPLSSAPTPELEAALRLVYHYCEGIRPPPGMKVVMRNETFVNLIVALHSSDITQHDHREVLALYYELAVRYFPIFKERIDLLQVIFEALTDERGLQHSHLRVRSRCCYLLLRLVKQMAGSGNGGSVLRAYVEISVVGIQRLLESNRTSSSLRPEDTLNLFETIGLLLGKTGLEPIKQKEYLAQVMTPHAESIQKILDQPHTISQDADYYSGLLSESIAAIAFLSKGFKSPGHEVREVLLKAIHISLAVLEAFPAIDDVRNKVTILLQRMIQCLKVKVLPFVPRFLQLLIEHCTSSDAIDVAQLHNQICIKFKGAAVSCISGSLLLLLRKFHLLMSTLVAEHQTTTGDVPSHLRLEQNAIQKLIYTVLQHIVVHRATAALLTANNISSLEDVLKSMGDGARFSEDPSARKVCLNFFRELLDQWTNSDGESLHTSAQVSQGLVQFVCSILIPETMQSFLAPSYNIRDAMQWRCVVELSQILHVLKAQQKVPEAFPQFLLTQLTEKISVGVPETFHSAKSAKDFEDFLKIWVQSQQPAKVSS